MERKSRYPRIVVLAAILMLSTMLQSDIISMVSSDVPIPPEASMTMFDPLEDLIYIYTGLPAEEYFDFVDAELVSLELSSFEPTLDCTITIRAGPPVDLDKTVWYTLMFDENNNASDNCMDYPWNDIDTMYTVIYTPTEVSIERAIYDGFWIVEDTGAWYGVASSLPGGFSVDIHIPLAELPELTETLPWKVKTEIHDGFPDLGDFVPDENLVYLEPKPDIVVSNLVHGEIVTGPTQTLTGHVKDPEVTEIRYNIASMLHEDSGTVPVLDGSFSFDMIDRSIKCAILYCFPIVFSNHTNIKNIY